MTEPHRPASAAADEPEHQEDEHLAIGKIVAVGIASLVFFALCSWWALRIWEGNRDALQPHGVLPKPRDIGQHEIGIVDQVPFGQEQFAQDALSSAERQLSTYGWIDRQSGKIHIPIDRAMELVANGRMP